jgi:hypothetical protein
MTTLSESDFQAQVVDLAKLRGWWVRHVRDERGNQAGWPDLTLIRGHRLVLAELKREDGRVRPSQAEVLGLLHGVRSVESWLWRPSNWPELEAVLK